MTRTPGRNASAGWYRDPSGRARLRWWDGAALTSWVSDGTAVVADPLPEEPRPITAADSEHLAFVREVYLPIVSARELVGDLTRDRLLDLAWDLDAAATVPMAEAVATAMTAPATLRQPPVATPTQARVPAPAPASRPPRSGEPMPRTEPAGVLADLPSGWGAPPPRSGPGPVARWWKRTTESVGSDLATHGLAYLGVLLLFVGVFGLVAFAFGDVAPTMRPVAEVGIALAPFAAAWMLLRRGADIAGRALETAGGLLLPVMLITSFLDGVPVPPDATGPVLVVALTAVTAMVSAGYWLWTRRHPTSALRHLVAPVAWLAAALAVTGVGREIPSGSGIAHVSAAQVAAIAVAMAVSLAWARWRPDALLSRPTQTAAVPGVIVTGLLAVLTWVGGAAVASILVTGFAGLLVLELLDTRVPQRLVRIAQPLWWAVVVVALLPSTGAELGGLAGAGLVGVVGYLALLELDSRSRDPWPLALSTSGLALTYLLTWTHPWWAFGVSLALAVWAGARRLQPYAVAHAAVVLDVCAGALPFATVLALGLATRHAPLAVLVGAALVLAACVPARVPAVRWVAHRDEHDHFWTLWWDAGMVAASAAVVVLALQYWPDVVSARWMVVVAPALLAVAAAVGPLPAWLRAWPTIALAGLSWSVGCAVVGTSMAVATLVPATVGLLVVVAAHVAGRAVGRWSDPGSLGLAGIALGLVSSTVSFATDGGYPLAATLGLVAAALLVTVVLDELRGSCVMETCRALVGRAALVIVPVLAEITLVASATIALDFAGWLTWHSGHWGVLPTALAVVTALLTNVPVSRPLRSVLTWTAVVASLVGVAAEDVPWAAIMALVVVVLLPLLLARTSRPRAAQWLAWSALVPLMVLCGQQWWPAYAALEENERASLALVSVGGALALGAFAADAVRRGWAARIVPADLRWRPAFVVGAVELAAGSVVALLVVGGPDGGRVLIASALVVVGLAVLSRTWSRLGIAALVGWVGVLVLWSPTLEAEPWIAVAATAALLAAAEVSRLLDPAAPVWARAPLPLLAVAHITALSAIFCAQTSLELARVLVGLGMLSALLSLELLRLCGPLRRPSVVAWAISAYAVLAGVLVVWAGALCGNGWLALALAVVAVACNVVATRVSTAPRAALVLVASVAGLSSWLAFLAWAGLSGHARTDATVMLGAAITLGSAALLRWTGVDRTVLLVRAGVAVSAAVLAPFAGAVVAQSASMDRWITWWTVAALAVSAVSCGLVAQPLAQPWLRHAAVVGGVAAVVEALVVVSATSTAQVYVLAALGVVTAVGLLTVGRAALGPWSAPAAVGSALTTVMSVGAALVVLPDTALLPVALLAAAICAASIGTAWHDVTLTVLAPVLACAAWIVWAQGALDGNPQWTTVPVGLTLLVIVGLVRRAYRERGARVDGDEVQLLELVGVAFLVGASYVQVFTVGLQYTLLAAALGLGVVVWGVLTRVRRRLVAGCVVVLTALLLLVLVPLAHLLPAFTSAAVWVAIAGIGLVALMAATLLEQGRAVVRRGIDELHHLTEGWE
jgi:hypothetical protein